MASRTDIRTDLGARQPRNIRHIPRLFRRHVHHPDIRRPPVRRAHERALRPIRRQHKVILHRRRSDDQLGRARTIGFDAVNVRLPVAIPLAREGNPPPARRPRSVVVEGGVVVAQQQRLARAVCVGGVELRDGRRNAVHQEHALLVAGCFAASDRVRALHYACVGRGGLRVGCSEARQGYEG